MPDAPGLGVELNEEVVKQHLRPKSGYFEPTPEWDTHPEQRSALELIGRRGRIYFWFFLRISSSRFLRYSSYSFLSAGSFGVP